MEDVDIEKVLFPESGELIKESTYYIATVLDDELDPFKCSFLNDGCVQINTEELTYLTLSRDNLFKLLELLEESESKYDDEEDDEE